MTPTEQGVAGGGLLGAGTGAIVGHALGNTGAGALIGAGVGAVSGGLIGNSVEKAEQRTQAQNQAQIAAAEARSQLGVADVIQMAHNHVSDSVIISQIRTSGTVYHLSAQEVLTLKQNGVSDAVVQEMLATANRVPRRYYSSAPVYDPVYEPAYVVAPAPPVAVGVGFGYSRYGRRW